jgi:hypothetical protein
MFSSETTGINERSMHGRIISNEVLGPEWACGGNGVIWKLQLETQSLFILLEHQLKVIFIDLGDEVLGVAPSRTIVAAAC